MSWAAAPSLACDTVQMVRRLHRMRTTLRARTFATTTGAVTVSHHPWPAYNARGRHRPELTSPRLVLALIAAGPRGHVAGQCRCTGASCGAMECADATV